MDLNNYNKIKSEYKAKNAWGLHSTIDLKRCNPATIRDANKIKQFVIELCNLIDMKRFGNPRIVNFGENKRVAGYSLTQLIETSLISGHFANQTNAVYLDVFSCKLYNPNDAAKYSKKFFEADAYKINVFFRI